MGKTFGIKAWRDHDAGIVALVVRTKSVSASEAAQTDEVEEVASPTTERLILAHAHARLRSSLPASASVATLDADVNTKVKAKADFAVKTHTLDELAAEVLQIPDSDVEERRRAAVASLS